MNKVKLAITRYDLTRFFFYAEENEIRFNGDYEIYSESIYYAGTAGSSLDWDESDLDEEGIKLLVMMLNILIKSHELYFKGE